MQPYFPNRSQLSGQSSVGWHGLVVGGLPSTLGTPIALDSNYVFGTSGDALGGTFMLPEDMTLTDFWFVASAKAGNGSPDSGGGVYVLDWEIRSGLGRGVNYSPGSVALVASGTIPCSGITVDTLCKVTPASSVSLTKGVFYTLIIGDVNGSGTTDMTTIRNNTRNACKSVMANSIETTNGWSSAGTQGSYAPNFVLKFSNGFVCSGSPLRGQTSLSSNTNLRGIKLTLPNSGPSLVWSGIDVYAGSIGGHTIYLMSGASQPQDIGSALWSHTFPSGITYSNSQSLTPYWFPEPLPKMVGGNSYYLVISPGITGTATPSKATQWGTLDADLRKFLSGYHGLGAAHVHATSTTDWGLDEDTISTCGFYLSIAAQPTLAA